MEVRHVYGSLFLSFFLSCVFSYHAKAEGPLQVLYVDSEHPVVALFVDQPRSEINGVTLMMLVNVMRSFTERGWTTDNEELVSDTLCTLELVSLERIETSCGPVRDLGNGIVIRRTLSMSKHGSVLPVEMDQLYRDYVLIRNIVVWNKSLID
jgi:hypothetical protein